MRALPKCCLIAILIFSFVEVPAFAAPSRSLGLVTQANHARVSSAEAISGVTVFDGDTLATDPSGTLRVRLGEAQLYLLTSTAVAVRQTAGGVSAALQRGTVVFTSANPAAFELRASEARFRARGTQPAYAQVTLVGPYEFLVTCQHGELEVSIGGEVHTVPEATSYRVTIEPSEQGPRGAGTDNGGQPPQPTGRSRWRRIALILIFGGTGIGIWRALVSPHDP